MKILFLGDVVGRSGRSGVINNLPTIIKINKIDFSIVNAENATSGMGLSVKHAKEILEIGADCITLGDHAFDQKEMLSFIEEESRILRPLNFSKTAPGRGSRVYSDTRGRKILVSQVLGQVFMKRPFDDPFSEIDGILRKNVLAGGVQASLVDMCGSFNSVIGMDKSEPLRRFVTGMSKERFTPADGEGTICGAIIETDDKSGLANSIEMLRLGGCLSST